ncbi:MAG: hypothetical protein MJY55_05775 [Bacteroidales bacterium]|nr:hypothetical protein [Bacteroidales bacterium]
MKTTIRTIILSAAAIFAAMSCQKEESVPGAQDKVNAGETIQVNINASLGDLVAADGTKATATSVVRLQWEDGDKVDAYCGTTKISGTDGLTVTPSENGIFAKLTGEITTTGLTSGTSVITFVYSSGCQANGLEFDFSTQTETDGIPFVAYGTLVYDGTATLTGKMVEFKFATSVMKIAATDLGGGKITDVAISGINTKVTLTPDDDSEICGISGDNKATISTTNYDASSDGTRAIVTVGLVPDNNKGRNISVTQTGFTNKGAITSAEIHSSTSYTTPASLFTCGTLGSDEKAHDYVLIAGTKWATQNLAVSASGKGDWTPDGSSTVTVPGTADEKAQIGDYFQWGAHKKYCGEETDADKGLLIYTAFTNNGSSGSFTWKKDGSSNDYQFSVTSISPYYESSAYKKYTTGDAGDGIVTLTPSDDVASILWSDTWRMPTTSEFKALKEATYWKWDDTDKGYYVYAPQTGDAGKKNTESTNTYTKSDALLFFPAAGFGYGTGLNLAGGGGFYWSSSLGSDDTGSAYYLRFDSNVVDPQNDYNRYLGFPVRPVSD